MFHNVPYFIHDFPVPSGKLTWLWRITIYNGRTEPFTMGKPTLDGPFSIATLVYQMVFSIFSSYRPMFHGLRDVWKNSIFHVSYFHVYSMVITHGLLENLYQWRFQARKITDISMVHGFQPAMFDCQRVHPTKSHSTTIFLWFS